MTGPRAKALTPIRRSILEFIVSQQRLRGFPPSVREIGEAVGLNSSSSVHAQLKALQELGYLRKDPTKPRSITINWDNETGGDLVNESETVLVPLVGRVAAGTGVYAEQEIIDSFTLPRSLTGNGELFVLTVKGESMIGDAILDGDYVVVRRQQTVEPNHIAVVGTPNDEATIKRVTNNGGYVTLIPSNPDFTPMVFPADQVTIYGRVVNVLRAL
ncbi:MAG: transcriptional repressor LexA [Acidimicrobiaceae bacterium]|nr:transcriptional repressor LexA [Acidimicrobiaceae bacterium]